MQRKIDIAEVSRTSTVLVLVWVATVLFTLTAVAQPVRQLPTHHVRPEVSSGRARFLNSLSPAQKLRINFLLPVRDQAGLSTFLQDVSNPSSASYRHFLTVADFADRFAPTQQDYDAVIAYAESNGMNVVYSPPNRLVLGVTASVGDIEKAFHVKMGVYADPIEHRTFYAPDREPTPDVNVALWHIGGLDNFAVPHPLYTKAVKSQGVISDATGSGPGGSFLGSDRRAAYYGQTALTGSGQAVGLFQLDGYNQSDVSTYFSNIGQSLNITLNNVLVDGASGGSDGDDTEQVIDIVEAYSMAPGMWEILTYIGPRSSFSPGVTDTDIFNRMATDNVTKQISCSWAWKPADPSSDDWIFAEMHSQGQNLFVASGDSGSYPNSSGYYYPAEDPYVVAVGGTSLTTNGPGGSWQSEVAWGGSGGGVSPDLLGIPQYQQGWGTINSSNGGSTSYRNIPDVGAEANQDNYYCANGSCGTGLGGTSLAAPTWAGFLALVNQQAAAYGDSSLGFLNPLIYPPSVTGSGFHDITGGSNGGYSAVSSYDLVTGWGSPNGVALINALLPPDFTVLISPGYQEVDNANPGPHYTVYYTVTVSPRNGFNGTVSLSPTCSGDVCDAPIISMNVSPQTITGGSGTATLSVTLTDPYCFQDEWQVGAGGTAGTIYHESDANVAIYPDPGCTF